MDEQTAISGMKQGDLNGLELLVKRHQVRAVHSAYLILYDRALAEDVDQTAFVKVAERIHQFDEQRPFVPWFFRIVVNGALKAAKRRRWTSRCMSPSSGWLPGYEIQRLTILLFYEIPVDQRRPGAAGRMHDIGTGSKIVIY